MKRSIINAIMEDAAEFFAGNQFVLPPFAFWSVKDWQAKGSEVENLVKNGLGWDITDYGLGDFQQYGLLLFTLRNGNLADWEQGIGVPYAEKIMIAEVGQIHQMHFHWHKREDIINRAGGELVIELYNATETDSLADSDVELLVNGQMMRYAAGSQVRLGPGESITLPTKTYHRFWAEGERVMIGEVSMINDDRKDNCFYQRIGSGRFSPIEEDETPKYLLFTDYERYWQNAEIS